MLQRLKREMCLSLILFLNIAAPPMANAGNVTYIYTDLQGTPLAEANSSGEITATFDYRPFGVVVLGVASSEYSYSGNMLDEDTGFLYMQARYYDAASGRFLGEDPIIFEGDKEIDLNRYSYALDNPMSFSDPSGMTPDDDQPPVNPQPKPLPPVTVTANRPPDIDTLSGSLPPPPPPKRLPESRRETIRVICYYGKSPRDGLVPRNPYDHADWNDLNKRNAEHFFFAQSLGQRMGATPAQVVVALYEMGKYIRHSMGKSTQPTALGFESGMSGAEVGGSNISNAVIIQSLCGGGK